MHTNTRVTMEGCIVTTEWDRSDNVTRIALVDDKTGREYEILPSQIDDLDEYIDEAVRLVARFIVGPSDEVLLDVLDIDYLFDEDDQMVGSSADYPDDEYDDHVATDYGGFDDDDVRWRTGR